MSGLSLRDITDKIIGEFKQNPMLIILAAVGVVIVGSSAPPIFWVLPVVLFVIYLILRLRPKV